LVLFEQAAGVFRENSRFYAQHAPYSFNELLAAVPGLFRYRTHSGSK